MEDNAISLYIDILFFTALLSTLILSWFTISLNDDLVINEYYFEKIIIEEEKCKIENIDWKLENDKIKIEYQCKDDVKKIMYFDIIKQ